MNIFADHNWWEPGQVGLFDIGDAGAILFFALALIGAIVGTVRWFIKQVKHTVREEIHAAKDELRADMQQATKQIQPGANGGVSLPDVARKTDVLEKMVLEVKKTGEETRDLLVNYISSDLVHNATMDREQKARTATDDARRAGVHTPAE